MLLLMKIGEFAQVSRLSIKTLRYYDRIGLLQPTEIDRFTGYRYYTLDLLPRLNRILALKDLGLTLTEIKSMLDDDVSADELRGILRMKQAELAAHLTEEQARLQRVEARLKQIEREGTMPEYEILTKEVAALRIASIHEHTTMDQIGQIVQQHFGTLMGHVDAHGNAFGGPGMTLYHEMAEGSNEIKMEIAVPVTAPIPETDQISIYELPAVEVATLVHHGPFESLSAAYGAMINWLQTNKHTVVATTREIYLQFAPDMPPEQYVTEIQFPIRRL